MKYKKMLIYMLVFALIFSPVSVCASDSAEESTEMSDAGVDEGGWYSSGVANISFYDNGYNFTRYWNYTLSGSKLYIIFNNNDVSYTVYSDSNVVVTNNYSTSKGDSGSWTKSDTTTRQLVYSNGGIHTNITFLTNLPVFAVGDTESIEDYLNDGDITGASNYEDLIPEEKVDVPEVKNLKITSGFYEGSRKENVWEFITPISVQWEMPDAADLWYEVQYRVHFYVLDKHKSPSDSIKTITTSWKYVDSSNICMQYGYAPYSAKISANVLESVRDEYMAQAFNDTSLWDILKEVSGFPLSLLTGSLSPSDVAGVITGDYYFANHKVEIRVRNLTDSKFNDPDVSDWVTVALDYDDNSSTGYTGDSDDEEGSTEEVDWETDDRVDEDDTEPTTEIDWDNDADGDVGLLDLIKTIIKLIGNVLKTITTALTTFINFIMSGFGLLGDNGLLSFFKSFFTFIPKDVWTLIGTGLSLSIILMVLRFFKK